MAQIASKSAGVPSAPHAEQLFKSYPVQHVEPAAIMRWLRQGWADIKANPSASLAYGITFALVGILMSMVSAANPAFFVAASTGFLLVGPCLRLVWLESSNRARGSPAFLVIPRQYQGKRY